MTCFTFGLIGSQVVKWSKELKCIYKNATFCEIIGHSLEAGDGVSIRAGFLWAPVNFLYAYKDQCALSHGNSCLVIPEKAGNIAIGNVWCAGINNRFTNLI